MREREKRTEREREKEKETERDTERRRYRHTQKNDRWWEREKRQRERAADRPAKTSSQREMLWGESTKNNQYHLVNISGPAAAGNCLIDIAWCWEWSRTFGRWCEWLIFGLICLHLALLRYALFSSVFEFLSGRSQILVVIWGVLVRNESFCPEGAPFCPKGALIIAHNIEYIWGVHVVCPEWVKGNWSKKNTLIEGASE